MHRISTEEEKNFYNKGLSWSIVINGIKTM